MISLKPPSPVALELRISTLQPPRLGVARVHAEELGGEQARLVAAGAGADLEDDVAVVVRVARQQQELQLLLERVGLCASDAGQLLLRQLAHLVVGVVEQRLRARPRSAPATLLPRRGSARRSPRWPTRSLASLRELLAVADHLGVGQQRLELVVALLDVRQFVKSCSTRGHAPPRPTRRSRAGPHSPRSLRSAARCARGCPGAGGLVSDAGRGVTAWRRPKARSGLGLLGCGVRRWLRARRLPGPSCWCRSGG